MTPTHVKPTPAAVAGYELINERNWTIIGVRKDKKPTGPWAIGGTNRYDYRNAETIFDQNPEGIAVVAGPSSLVIIDFDNDDAIIRWARQHGVPETLISETPRGKHVFYKAPDNIPIQPSTSLEQGVDVRAGESYAVIPPSSNMLGPYKWKNQYDIAPLPPHVLDLIRTRKADNTNLPDDDEEIPEGQRNDKLFNIALRLWRSGLTKPVVKAGVVEHARIYAHGTMTEVEIDGIVNSAKKYHDRNPKHTSDDDETTSSIITTTFASMGEPLPVHWARGETGAGRIPLGEMTMIYGEPGVGKGSITMSIISEISNAGGRVLLSTPEDDTLRVVKPRLIAAGANLNNVAHITSRATNDEETTVDIARDANTITQAAIEYGAELIVIDPVSEHFGADVKDERKNREQLSPFMRACREHQIAILAVGHTNRMAGGSGYMRAGGSSALYKIARSAFIVGRVPTADEDQSSVTKNVALIHDKTNLGKKMPGIVYTIQTEEIAIVDGKPITTSVAKRVGETDLSSEDILDERKIADQRKVGECAAWLSSHLDDKLGLSNKEEVESEARKIDQAWTPTLLKTAAQSIGAKCKPSGYQKPWIYVSADYEEPV